MLSTQTIYQKPVFKNRVLLNFRADAVEIRDRHSGFSLSIEPEFETDITKLLQLLQTGGFFLEQLTQACPQIAGDIPDLLAVLGDRGFLEESANLETPSTLTGQQFYRRLERFLNSLKQQFPPSPFALKMADGSISREQLIGYVLESYHVTHLCPRLLAPSLANYESATTHKLLQEFYVSELHHDRLVENSLTSVGITVEQIKRMQPLPMTFAVCSTLGVFARQHPLSFKTALMLFEEDDRQFHRLFEQQCQSLELPSAFYQPILLHAKINEDGSHEEITQVLLAEVASVSQEEQLLVQKNMATLMELMVLRTNEILTYYGDSQNIVPRCFELEKRSKNL